MADLADRVIVDSAASENHEACLREIAALIEDPEMPAIGDLQWVGLSPWRSLLADTFGAPERAGDLEKIERAEILYAPGGENRALLLVGWLASTLGWKPESASRNGGGQNIEFSGPSGRIIRRALSRFTRRQAEAHPAVLGGIQLPGLAPPRALRREDYRDAGRRTARRAHRPPRAPSTSGSWSGKSCAIAGATKLMNDLCVRPWRYSTCERPRL